jgi:hypothetical protein
MRRMMERLNVEFEFQVRQALKASVQATEPAAPAPQPVEAQDISGQPPAEATATDAPAVLSPPPQNLATQLPGAPTTPAVIAPTAPAPSAPIVPPASGARLAPLRLGPAPASTP